eukprot:366551-Chlamydomonas_euryale.AAC.16
MKLLEPFQTEVHHTPGHQSQSLSSQSNGRQPTLQRCGSSNPAVQFCCCGRLPDAASFRQGVQCQPRGRFSFMMGNASSASPLLWAQSPCCFTTGGASSAS